MPILPPSASAAPCEVRNQPPDRGDVDLWTSDPALREAVARAGAPAAPLAVYGREMGRAEMRAAGRAANRNAPELVPRDSAGQTLDEVRFDPGWHCLMRTSIGAGYAALPWEGGPAGHAAHAAMVYMAAQIEPGHCCPLTMTYAAHPALAASDALAAAWQPLLASRRYDPAPRPLAEKQGATLGMALTETQGGSDLRATATRAEPDGEAWRLTGHKWFCSAPMSDGFLTLARAPGGLTCFLVPRWLPGEGNAIRLLRLKDKLGNRSNASAEIEYDRALAWQLGEIGDGIRTILTMVHHTRLDTALAPAGLMRAALSEAHHWVAHRTAFQKRLIDQPLMRAVLADLALDVEGAVALGLRVAAAVDRARDGETEAALARIAVALAKFQTNKQAPPMIAEAMEVLGGNGYIEDCPLPLLYREAPLNGIWEGSANVICLDILRTLAREPLAAEALAAELHAAAGADRLYDAELRAHAARWPGLPNEAEARWYAEQTALLLTASVLLRGAPDAVAEAFIATRLGARRGRAAGAFGRRESGALLDRLGPSTEA
ncbi:acyl-CoA dehydrogenase family protein [Rhodovulum kholense]|uniref:Putative acyl-CoA dehydrogenase n=1 Tax=Rhodovulum kholense TaxID=453584 RepID=A0A8E3ARW3_9RHOB|nr:acyl-CoA dehydrogenase family protein [Rhodovulum kholense]PTW50160.1 putative acyl-CoA dehydrogenase [Rhodovulum kholense]